FIIVGGWVSEENGAEMKKIQGVDDGKKIMETAWFKRRGWLYQTVSWQGVVVVAGALLFCAQVFLAVDRRSHSVSDTLYGVIPFFVCSFLLLDWIAARTSRE